MAPDEVPRGTTRGALAAPYEAPSTIVIRHILLKHNENPSTEHFKRTRAEAFAQLETARGEILAGADMGEIAVEMSEDASARRGGFLGTSTRDAWVPEFADVAWSLREGEISSPVDTPFGVHLIRRESDRTISLRHIVVIHQGSTGAKGDGDETDRTREAALERAETALSELESGVPFDEVARRYSDGPAGARGGDLGVFLRGELGPRFDDVAFDLVVDERSDVVESPFGFHIVERYE